MAQFLEKDQITEFDTLNLQRTPLYIHVLTNRRSNDFKAYGTNRYETYYSQFIRLILRTIFVLVMICFQMNIPVLLFYVMVASLQTNMHTKTTLSMTA